ncbi:MAG: peptidoglycan bridge formation glycyltransferase FemA/FemB family protein [Bacteroidales bacterium]|nr:peptidoglycan bridge formation glycyltransferase FemA/FemB family protein [Bacteroidales bacterium]
MRSRSKTLWKAIQIAKANKCLEYDMFGIAHNPDPSHPMYGLTLFFGK